jgi:hypothetical protein
MKLEDYFNAEREDRAMVVRQQRMIVEGLKLLKEANKGKLEYWLIEFNLSKECNVLFEMEFHLKGMEQSNEDFWKMIDDLEL